MKWSTILAEKGWWNFKNDFPFVFECYMFCLWYKMWCNFFWLLNLRISWSMQWYDYFNMSNSWIRLCQFHSSDKHKCFFCWRSTPNPNEEVLNFAHLLLMFGVSRKQNQNDKWLKILLCMTHLLFSSYFVLINFFVLWYFLRDIIFFVIFVKYFYDADDWKMCFSVKVTLDVSTLVSIVYT